MNRYAERRPINYCYTKLARNVTEAIAADSSMCRLHHNEQLLYKLNKGIPICQLRNMTTLVRSVFCVRVCVLQIFFIIFLPLSFDAPYL